MYAGKVRIVREMCYYRLEKQESNVSAIGFVYK